MHILCLYNSRPTRVQVDPPPIVVLATQVIDLRHHIITYLHRSNALNVRYRETKNDGHAALDESGSLIKQFHSSTTFLFR